MPQTENWPSILLMFLRLGIYTPEMMDWYTTAHMVKSSKQARKSVLSKHQLYFCPICYHLNNLQPLEENAKDCENVLSLFMEKERDLIDPVFSNRCSLYAFTSILDLLLHLHHGHDLEAVLSEKLLDFLECYRVRGADGLAKTYTEHRLTDGALENGVTMSTPQLLQYYWAEPSRAEEYNKLVKLAVENKRANIYSMHLELQPVNKPLRGYEKELKYEQLAYLNKEKKRIGRRIWSTLTTPLGIGRLRRYLPVDYSEDDMFSDEDGYVFME